MNSANRHAEYLAKARDAEERAAEAQDKEMRESWTQIAENYRVLARRYAEVQKCGRHSGMHPFNPDERRQNKHQR